MGSGCQHHCSLPSQTRRCKACPPPLLVGVAFRIEVLADVTALRSRGPRGRVRVAGVVSTVGLDGGRTSRLGRVIVAGFEVGHPLAQARNSSSWRPRTKVPGPRPVRPAAPRPRPWSEQLGSPGGWRHVDREGAGRPYETQVPEKGGRTVRGGRRAVGALPPPAGERPGRISSAEWVFPTGSSGRGVGAVVGREPPASTGSQFLLPRHG